MDYKNIIKVLKEKKWLVFWLTVFGAVLFFDLLVIMPPKYKANSSILVVQKQVEGQDIYSISKSAQYICQVLKEGLALYAFFHGPGRTGCKAHLFMPVRDAFFKSAVQKVPDEAW